MHEPLYVNAGDGLTQGEWPVFIAFWCLWTLPAGFGMSWIKKTILNKSNGACVNWCVALTWVFIMWMMWVSMFYFWRQVVDLNKTTEYQYYQAGMWLFFLDAIVAAPFPYFVARNQKAMAALFSGMFFVVSVAAFALTIQTIPNMVAPSILTAIVSVVAGTVFFFVLFAACDACCTWPKTYDCDCENYHNHKRSKTKPREERSFSSSTALAEDR